MPKLDIEAIPQSNATGYPEPFARPVEGRWWRRLAPAGGLTAMGASHVVLKPGAWSSQRPWHADEDELLVMLSGEAVLVEDAGRTLLRAGDVCAWPMAAENGHHLMNESSADCSFVAISAGNAKGSGSYPDIDMQWGPHGYTHKDGTPY
ncbi:cupin domain-containing protein [Erythrobacter arachoides]|uniref:Cupin domain-containing protein n=1 Tax=Aurantiacibacter arachoides TaxID=1850444 RepID=A0A844ZWS9_9SPHN|nr:cupin domain-containing protein [Aurantiacibacter arachoides]MXO92198.1 cupin domain-containing protein [Aurantiacibacter arachoides]GGD58914.1 transcriptional regulator [Aurantiacibacter arachoides]